MAGRVLSFVLLAILLLAPFAGCTSKRGTGEFMTEVNSIRPGTPMDAVRDELGKPDDSREGVMPAVPPPGPLEPLVGRLPAGTPYRHWVYKRGDSRFHIIFARTIVQSGDRWEVVSVRSLPASAVY